MVFAEAEVKAVPIKQIVIVVGSMLTGAMTNPEAAEHTTRQVRRNLAKEQ